MYHSSVYRKYPILFVDDEEKALKYFRLAFGKGFEIIVAGSVAEAKAILEARGEEIGVLVTDQRMPEQTGVELLKHVRARYPAVVRILTTAYSDLDDAIEAVNSGEIYRYVTKPWDINDLRGELVRAMDLHVLRRERDLLLAEKLSVLQRKVAVDRARDLLMFASALPWVRNALPAVWDFVRQGLGDALSGTANQGADASGLEHWAGLESEILRSQSIFRAVSQELVPLVGRSTPEGALPPRELLADALGVASERNEVQIESVILTEDPIRCHGDSARRLFELTTRSLLEKAGDGDSTVTLTVKTQASAAEMIVTVEAVGVQPFEAHGDEKARQILADMLSAYLIAGHHGGSVAFGRPEHAASRFTIALPRDPEAVADRRLPDGWLEEVFARYEDWPD